LTQPPGKSFLRWLFLQQVEILFALTQSLGKSFPFRLLGEIISALDQHTPAKLLVETLKMSMKTRSLQTRISARKARNILFGQKCAYHKRFFTLIISVYAVSTLEIAKLQISAQIRKSNPNFFSHPDLWDLKA
jgi:hypothetical protein